MHKEGRITAERQVEGARKGQWLFNRATVRSVDRLYEHFESKPLVPELAAAGRPAGRAQLPARPRDCGCRNRLPGWLRYRIELSGTSCRIAVYQLLGLVVLVCSWSCRCTGSSVWPLTRLVRSLMALEGCRRR